ncbi:hypothetical protein FQN55_000776 [Onygenales sp. PD_40]|nr:hypothetical protein FQN55_000776 [Onygenales sp. PD_40]KAK2775484.1 hypothetical protein FQN53_003114 [Emmonsiellopsis sp. PD_33]
MEGDSVSTWSRLENPASTGPDMLVDTTGPLTPPPHTDSPPSPLPPTSSTEHQQNGSSNNAQCCGRDMLGCLPPKVIKRILYVVDANGFASLVLLNKEWRRVSDLPELYRHHLDGCIGGVLVNEDAPRPWASEDLYQLKRRFAQEARRNLFESFLRPQKTLVNLISVSASSSSAFPQGEAFQFAFSANGRQLLALSSSRILVIGLSTNPLSVRYELKTLRRPVTATILDDASLLAVVSSNHQVNIYRLEDGNVRLIQVITLDEVPRTITLSPEGAVLAIAYDGGIEVHALGQNSLATDRRAVRCFDIDVLSFSRDGLMLVGSSTNASDTKMVSISPPLYTDLDSEIPSTELQSRMWTTQILFPDINVGYNNMAIVPSTTSDQGSTWIVGYDAELKVFRLGQIDDAQGGAVYFVGPGADGARKEPGPSLLPAASCNGEVLALGFQRSGVWLYGIPNIADRSPTTNLVWEQNWNTKPACTNSQRLNKVVKPPSYLVHGCTLSSMTDVMVTKWVGNTTQGAPGNHDSHRLVAAAPGGVNSILGKMGNDQVPTDGGRIMIFDFERSPTDGKTVDITIEVGEVEPTPLPERDSNLDVEVELERRRTQVNRRGRGLGRTRNAVIGRSATLARHRASIDSTYEPTAPTGIHRTSISQPNSPTDGNLTIDFQSVDSPYSNTQPRSQDILSRAATAAAGNRGRPRYQSSGSFGTRRALVPHESDADNWVPPPPPYTPDAEGPLPEHIRRTLLPSMTEPLPGGTGSNSSPTLRRSQTSRFGSMTQNVTQRIGPSIGRMGSLSVGTLSRIRRPSEARNEESPIEANDVPHHPPSSSRRGPSDGSHTRNTSSDNRPMDQQVQPVGRSSLIPSNLARQIDARGAVRPNVTVPAPRLITTPHGPVPMRDFSPSAFSYVPPGETNPRRRSYLSGAALQERLDRPTPPTPLESPQSPINPPRVIGRNGPTHHLVSDQMSPPSTTTPPTPPPPQEGSLAGSSAQYNPQRAMEPSSQTLAATPNTSSPLRERLQNGTLPPPRQSSKHPPSRQNTNNMSPIAPKPYAISTPNLLSREPRRMETIYSIRSNQEVRRSRPRSSDIPRRKPVAGTSFFDKHTGRVISSSHSDAGPIGRRMRHEDMRDGMSEWSQPEGEKKKKGGSKCTIM